MVGWQVKVDLSRLLIIAQRYNRVQARSFDEHHCLRVLEAYVPFTYKSYYGPR